jgi:glycosyltransferase involved in cell wall biosynthesis
MSHNVLYLSYDGMTDPLGQSQVLPYVVGLTNNGYSFHIISFEKKDRFLEYGNYIQTFCDANGIQWYPLTYTKSPPLLSTVYDVHQMKRLAHSLHKKNQFSIVHCRSYLPAIVGLGMKNRFKTKFLFDMRGFWADERVDGGLWNLKNPIYKSVYKYFKSKENQFLVKADQTISLTFAGKNEILKWKGLSTMQDKISVIPCCADLELFRPVEETSTNDFTLGYLGSLGTWYMMDEMMYFFKLILEKVPNASFHILTKDDKKYIFETAKKYSIDDKHIIVQEASRADIPELTKYWNFSIFFIKPSYSKKSSSPTKQGELMGLGIPIICNRGVGDVSEIVNKYKSGVLVDDVKNPNLDSIFNFKSNKHDLHNSAQKYFSLKEGIKSYLKIYRNIC